MFPQFEVFHYYYHRLDLKNKPKILICIGISSFYSNFIFRVVWDGLLEQVRFPLENVGNFMQNIESVLIRIGKNVGYLSTRYRITTVFVVSLLWSYLMMRFKGREKVHFLPTNFSNFYEIGSCLC